MKYPFEFPVLLLTETVLDVLGFGEYNDGVGDFGWRNLELGGYEGDGKDRPKREYASFYRIVEMDTKNDSNDGFGNIGIFVSAEFRSSDMSPIYFLHDMYEDIAKRRTPEELSAFVEITKKDGVNMFYYIKAYLDYKGSIPSLSP